MTEAILIGRRDNVLDVVLNRPHKHNAINLEIVQGLQSAVTQLAEDRSLRVMLIRANGKYFSAGADLNSELFPDPSLRSMADFRRWYRRSRGSLHPVLDEFEAAEKPIVVAHQRPSLGGALEMSLSCDFRLAAASARYALPETALGSLPGSGGVSRLTRVVGPHWAKWFIMANLPMSAERALAAGLVHDLYPDEQFDARVWSFCENLASQPPETVAAAKLAIELAADLERGQARNVERLAVSGLVMGDEFKTLLAEVRARLTQKNGPGDA
jgi:enoyl-CoA hydratase/carnithine racemase